ncbi:MAG: hypothetical protein V4608_10590 [Bacteroidota bacterium]
MKFKFLESINEYGEHIVKLYNFDKEEATKFKQAIQQTIIDGNKSLDLDTLDYIEPVNCKLILRLSETDEGIISINDENFDLLYCNLTMNAYKKMLNLIEPYCSKNSRSFQMLYDLDTEIDFLFTPVGD